MKPCVNSPESEEASSGGGRRRFFGSNCLYQAWRVSIVITLATGIFHLLNLIGTGRAGFGPALITFFRASFVISWALLAARWAVEKKLPRVDRTDGMVALLAMILLVRGAFTPETLTVTINWIVTGCGVFFLVRFGMRDAFDVKLVLAALVGAALVISAFGVIEYALKSNPLFESIQIDVIGADARVAASDQFYRIRSLVGHPGFVGAILLGSAPLALLLFWRRRLLAVAAITLMFVAVFLTFSRGSWLIGLAILLPGLFFLARRWFVRNIRWVAPIALVAVALVTFDYVNREEVTADFSGGVSETGLHMIQANDGPVSFNDGDAGGVSPRNKYVYFDIDQGFFGDDGPGPVTLTMRYIDRGLGAVHVEYDSKNETAGIGAGAYTATPSFNKTDTGSWTTAAFYLENPRFEHRENAGTDFRIVDQDSAVTVGQVVVQKGRLKLPDVVAQQWMSRGDSISTRANLALVTRDLLFTNPLGVGLFNSPGTDHHAVDSLPLTWLNEFGWLGFLLIGGLVLFFINEGRHAWKRPGAPATLVLVSLLILFLHGGHLMILYDKPSLVLIAAVGALYANIRPWRRGGAVISLSNDECMV